nr:hypothetical protein [Candidatus Sigynarchaeum springense]
MSGGRITDRTGSQQREKRTTGTSLPFDAPASLKVAKCFVEIWCREVSCQDTRENSSIHEAS